MRILSRILIVCLCCLSYTHTVFAGNCYNITDLAAVGRAKGFIKYGEAWNNLHYVLCGTEQNMCGVGDIVFDYNRNKLSRCTESTFEVAQLSSIPSCNIDAAERNLSITKRCGQVPCYDYKIQAYDGKYIVYYKPNGTTTNALQQLCVANSTLYNKLKTSCEGSGGTMSSYSGGILSCNCNSSGAREQFRCQRTPGACNWTQSNTTCNRDNCLTRGSKKLFCNVGDANSCNTGDMVQGVNAAAPFKKCTESGWRTAVTSDYRPNCSPKQSGESDLSYTTDTLAITVYYKTTASAKITGLRYCNSASNNGGASGGGSSGGGSGGGANGANGTCNWVRSEIGCNANACLTNLGNKLFCNDNTRESTCKIGDIVKQGINFGTDTFKKCTQNGWRSVPTSDVNQSCTPQQGEKSISNESLTIYYKETNSARITDLRYCNSASNNGGSGGGVSAGAGAGGAGTGAGAGGGSGNLSCTNLGQTEQAAGKGTTSYHICEVDGCSETRDCHSRDMLTAHATDGHCVSVGRQGYKICTATACEDNYEPYQGYCKKKDPAANSTPPSQTPPADPNTGTPPSTITVSGFVKDKSNGEPLQMATLAYGGTQSVTTNNEGKFEIPAIASDVQVSISYVGCTPVTKAASELVDATVELECATDVPEVNVIRLACSHVGEQESTEQFQTRYKICEIDECSDKRDCVDDMLPSNAATGECVSAERTGYKICTPATCVDGYTLNSETATCEPNAAPTNTNTTDINTTPTVDKVKEAEEAYKKAKENEQSLANRTLGAASTAATGLGLMNAAAAYSEQQADDAAEKDMTAYLETFRCEYGKGQTAKAGNEEITLPGGNDLLTYYTEYKQIADALKNTKKALGMRPGIEEEVVYDRAETGLYQYSSVGKTGGAYTSLANALTDTEGEDAAAWQAQKDETKKKLKTGVIAAGAGIVGGIAGNMAINGANSTAGTDLTGLFDKISNKNTNNNQTENTKNNNNNNNTEPETNNNRYGIDLSQESLNNVGYNLTGNCAKSQFAESDIREDGKCSDLLTTKGTWWTSFNYGIVYGEAKCEVKPFPADPPSTPLAQCFCKVTSLDDNTATDSDWVYVTNYGSKDLTKCNDKCATSCSSYTGLSVSEELRKKLLKSFLTD